ncbi:MAG: hypothetical protein JAZ11_02870 [Candidatus Thiodiazotropha lotti]|nr:hypothetical protein [Candidatus Thiodiazotropha lotti]
MDVAIRLMIAALSPCLRGKGLFRPGFFYLNPGNAYFTFPQQLRLTPLFRLQEAELQQTEFNGFRLILGRGHSAPCADADYGGAKAHDKYDQQKNGKRRWYWNRHFVFSHPAHRHGCLVDQLGVKSGISATNCL